MNNKELQSKVSSAISLQIKKRGFATIVDTLIDIGYLEQKDYLAWRSGCVLYLEKVCKTNLNKLSSVVRFFREYGKNENYYFSYTVYKSRKNNQKLRFTKTNNKHLENLYSTSIVLKND